MKILTFTYVFISISQEVVLKEGTEQYERWVNIPQPINFKVYFFNVSNPNEIINGATPVVKEIGPFFYR